MSTQRDIADRLGLPVHPPKVEVFDLVAGTNTDPKQHVRAVDRYRLTGTGLYLARRMPGHPDLAALESWLLPEAGLRVTRWYHHPGKERELDFYLDVVDVDTGPERWSSRDLYLDVEVLDGRRADLLDVDEFVTAVGAGLLDEATAARAMRTACAAVEGLAARGYRFADWLAARGVELSWQGPPADLG